MSTLREDRFFYSIPITSQEKFRTSNFLKWYDKTEPYPEKSKIIKNLRRLPGGPTSFSKICKAIETTPDDYDVIRTYTSNMKVGIHTFYTYINQQLCKDDEDIIRKLMPLIRRATRQINYNASDEDSVVYRGMQLNAKQRSYFKVGTIFRFPGFTSTSKSKRLAENFGNTLFEIHIYSGCLQVKNIAGVSYYPAEKEYLFSPYSLFKVTGRNGKLITLQALDNQSNVEKDQSNTNIWGNFLQCCPSNCIIL